jgi:multiple sugar transport system ATP-binding protein
MLGNIDMPLLDIQGVSKYFGTTQVLSDIDLDVKEGEIISLLGPSGCGKSTLLRIVAGLETANAGSVVINGRDMSQVPPRERDIAMVFQSLALYPHLTAGENIALPLRARHMTHLARMSTGLRRILPRKIMPAARRTEAAISDKVVTLATKLSIEPLLDRHPAQLSGGQRQRVAIGRALVRDSRLLLLDEPLSSLDAKLRVQARNEIVDIQRMFGLTCIFVTHDQAEAFAISDRIAVMLNGKIAQFSTPSAIYRDPVSLDVAQFVGTPTINCLPARIESDGDVRAGMLVIENPRLALPAGTAVTLAVRPEHVLLENHRGARNAMRVVRVEDHGHDGLVHLEGEDGASLIARANPTLRLKRGDTISAGIAQQHALFFGADGRRILPEPVRLVEFAHG